jgi:hypothetical protein
VNALFGAYTGSARSASWPLNALQRTRRETDPALPELLRDFRDALVIEKAERAGIAAEMRARAS